MLIKKSGKIAAFFLVNSFLKLFNDQLLLTDLAFSVTLTM
jgi:hypothetical protein